VFARLICQFVGANREMLLALSLTCRQTNQTRDRSVIFTTGWGGARDGSFPNPFQGLVMPKSPNPTDVHVGLRVRMRRLMLDLSQTDLARALGVTFQQVQKYEKGANRISASRLQVMSHFLKVPIHYFFEGLAVQPKSSKDEGHHHDFVSEFFTSSDGVSLSRAFMRIRKASLRRSIVDLVETMAGMSD